MSGSRFSNVKKFAKGDVIVQEGDASSKEMFIVLQGTVGVYNNFQMVSHTQTGVLGPGNFHGEMALFLNQPQKDTLVALTDVLVFVINRKNAAELFSTQPDMTFTIIEGVCKKLDHANKFLEKHETANKKQSASGSSSLFPEKHGSYMLPLEQDNRELLYEQRMTCPLCGYSFANHALITTKLRLEKTDPDLRQRYKEIEPMHYEVITCPNCFLSATSEAFPTISKRWIHEVNQAVGPFKLEVDIKTGADRDTFTIFAGYYLAVLCASICFDEYQLIRANLWQKLSRLYQDCDDKDMYDYASTKALEDYLYAYEHFNISDKQEQQLCYIIGDLYSRSGDTDNARNYFYLAKSNKGGSNIMRMQADKRMDAIRDQKSREATR